MSTEAVKLQQLVNDFEGRKSFRSVEDLSSKVAQSNWAQAQGYESDDIVKLFKKHKIQMRLAASKGGVAVKEPPVSPRSSDPIMPPPREVPPTKSSNDELIMTSPKEVPPPKVSVISPAPKTSVINPVTLVPTESVPRQMTDNRTDTGGRGRKLCRSCSKYVGVRITKCPCGYTFTESDESSKTKEVQDNRHEEGGVGRKQCPNCKMHVGFRTIKCFCNYIFDGSEKRSEPKVVKPKEIQDNRYDEGGLGKKQCPNCKKYVGVRTAKCFCDYVFDGSEKSTSEAKEVQDNRYDEGGFGRKQCSGCNKYVGARTAKCFCGYDFPIKEGGESTGINYYAGSQHTYLRHRHAAAALKAQEAGARNVLWTPAGQPPVPINAISRKEIGDWAESVRSYELDHRERFVSLSALLYWANAFVEKSKVLKKEHAAKLCGFLVDIYRDEWAESPCHCAAPSDLDRNEATPELTN